MGTSYLSKENTQHLIMHLGRAYKHLTLKDSAYKEMQIVLSNIKNISKNKNPAKLDDELKRLESSINTIVRMEKGHPYDPEDMARQRHKEKLEQVESKLDRYLKFHDDWQQRVGVLDEKISKKMSPPSEPSESEIELAKKKEQIVKLRSTLDLFRNKYQLLLKSRQYDPQDLEKIKNLIDSYEQRLKKLTA